MRFLGVTRIFWIGVVLTIALIVIFRYTTLGRRFQVVGANPTASRIAGLRVNGRRQLPFQRLQRRAQFVEVGAHHQE